MLYSNIQRRPRVDGSTPESIPCRLQLGYDYQGSLISFLVSETNFDLSNRSSRTSALENEPAIQAMLRRIRDKRAFTQREFAFTNEASRFDESDESMSVDKPSGIFGQITVLVRPLYDNEIIVLLDEWKPRDHQAPGRCVAYPSEQTAEVARNAKEN
jgi:hypothetical protein